jgi:hypothetical protein
VARITVYVTPICWTVPEAPATATWSPSRNGCTKATRIPAMKFDSVVCAARPTISAITADEARIVPATARTGGITSRALKTPTPTMTAMTLRRTTR